MHRTAFLALLALLLSCCTITAGVPHDDYEAEAASIDITKMQWEGTFQTVKNTNQVGLVDGVLFMDGSA